jgi:hypothetical protein
MSNFMPWARHNLAEKFIVLVCRLIYAFREPVPVRYPALMKNGI